MKPVDIALLVLERIDFDEAPASVAEVAVKVLTGPPHAYHISAAQALVDAHQAAIERRLRDRWNK
jgi:hypothetical protein